MGDRLGVGRLVWEIVQMWEDFGAVEALCADTELTPAQMRLALAYRDAYPEEVTAAIEDNRRPLGDVEALYPFIEVTGR